MKKTDLPAMPFYFGDWRKAPEIRALPLDIRMIWFEMLGYMWESTERGYLTLNKKPIDIDTLSLMLGIEKERLTLALTLMDKYMVYSKRENDDAIYNRKMVKDEEIRLKRAAGGVLGGNPLLTKSKGKKKGYPYSKPSSEIENEIVNEFLNIFKKVSNKNRIKVIDDKTKRQLNILLKDYNMQDIENAIINACNDSYHQETKLKYITPEFITRPDKFQKFVSITYQEKELPEDCIEWGNK